MRQTESPIKNPAKDKDAPANSQNWAKRPTSGILAGVKRLFNIKIKPVDMLFFLGLSVLFFSLPMLLAPDSDPYIQNARVLAGVLPWGHYSNYRMPGFPLLLRLSFFMFGESAYGTLVLFYLLYVLLIVLILYLLRLLGLRQKLGRLGSWIVCCIMVFCNTTLLTYAHHVLVEFPAMVLAVAGMVFLVKTADILKKGDAPKRMLSVRLARYAGAALLMTAGYFLKQMFFVLPFVVLALSELGLWLHTFSLKRFAAGAVAILLAVVITLASAGVWERTVMQSLQNTNYSVEGLASSTLVDGLRFFRIQQEDRGVLHTPVQVDVMEGDGLTVRKSFIYTFKGSFGDSLAFVLRCFFAAPDRFAASYAANYLVIANVLRIDNIGVQMYWAYDPLMPGIHALSDQNENGYWSSRFTGEKYTAGKNAHDNAYEFPTEGLEQYVQWVDDGFASNLLFNTPFRQFCFLTFSLAGLLAPGLFLLALVMIIIAKKKRKDFIYWERLLLLAGSIFGYILFLAATASSLDRYAAPAMVWGALMLVHLAVGVWGMLRLYIAKILPRLAAAGRK